MIVVLTVVSIARGSVSAIRLKSPVTPVGFVKVNLNGNGLLSLAASLTRVLLTSTLYV